MHGSPQGVGATFGASTAVFERSAQFANLMCFMRIGIFVIQISAGQNLKRLREKPFEIITLCFEVEAPQYAGVTKLETRTPSSMYRSDSTGSSRPAEALQDSRVIRRIFDIRPIPRRPSIQKEHAPHPYRLSLPIMNRSNVNRKYPDGIPGSKMTTCPGYPAPAAQTSWLTAVRP